MTVKNEDREALKAIKPATITRVVKYLEDELCLSIYGYAADVETGEMFGANMDYDIDEILQLRKLFLSGGELVDPRGEHG